MGGILAISWTLCCAAALVGCRTTHPYSADLSGPLPPPDMPRELSKVVLPIYTIEPPDILVIEAIHIVPKTPYMPRTGDVIAVNVLGTLPDAPVSGPFPVQPGGMVNLGPTYGAAKVTGLT